LQRFKALTEVLRITKIAILTACIGVLSGRPISFSGGWRKSLVGSNTTKLSVIQSKKEFEKATTIFTLALAWPCSELRHIDYYQFEDLTKNVAVVQASPFPTTIPLTDFVLCMTAMARRY